MGDQKVLKDCHRLEIEDTWQLTAMQDPELNPGNRKIWVISALCLTVLLQSYYYCFGNYSIVLQLF
jgi:hypothetical protein